MVPQQYCLRWKHHHTNVQSMFAQLLEKERFCDVTLYCSPNFAASDKDNGEAFRGVSLRAHRVVLASCSELLGALLAAHEAQGEPVLVVDGAEPRHVRALLDYMYTGEMNVHHTQLAALLKTAEELRIKGLTDIRWNNKNELPDCQSGVVTTTSIKKNLSPERKRPNSEESIRIVKEEIKTDKKEEVKEKINVNGGPPPLIKLPLRMPEKSISPKKERSDNESPSPKRRRVQSGNEHSDDEEREPEWHHGNMDISAERVVSWGGAGAEPGSDSHSASDASDDEWADAPADIGSFLRTKLRVDGDNSADEDSNDEAPPSTSSSAGASHADLPTTKPTKLTVGPKSGPTDPRFTDVVKLNDYLKHGRRPQFWEEHYVKRVMEAVRVKELEMKQAAEILGVSYGTLYGRYRDVFGCINRPYRTARDFWQAKGPAEILERLQRGELTLDAGAIALGVSPSNLAAYMADLTSAVHHFTHHDKDMDPIPIEVDPSLKKSLASSSASTAAGVVKLMRSNFNVDKAKKSNVPASTLPGLIIPEEEPPATVISTYDITKSSAGTAANKWPSIRVANIESLRGVEPPPATTPSPTVPSSTIAPSATLAPGITISPCTTVAPGVTVAPSDPTSPTLLMRTRPDLTIVAARKPDKRDDDDT